MASPPGFPRSLLGEPWSVRLAYFQRYTVAHPRLMEAKEKLVAAIQNSEPNSLVFVFGPTGVGKTTLRLKTEQILTEDVRAELEQDRGRLAMVSVEAVAPESGSFSWRDHFKRLLQEMDEPLIEYKRDLQAAGVSLRSPARPKPTTGEYRYGVEQALRFRRPAAVMIDEAQHLAKIASGRRLLDQLDVIKSIANGTQTVHVLYGTYELLAFRNLNGQLSRRSIDVHFPRYRAESAGDRKAFISVLRSFAQQLPLAEPPDMTSDWEFLYERSVGCVGVLKQWLVRALSAVLRRDENTLSRRHLESHALSVPQVDKILAEASEGEMRLRDSWDLTVEPVAARSRLYSLTPIGLGTPFVESLIGYVVRLAEAHAVSTGSLVGKELSGSINSGGIDLGNVPHAINGVGGRAKRWVRALGRMTLRSDLQYMTLLPFESVFPKPFLFRRVRAWCPSCYELMASQHEVIYEQLLWCLKLVEVCPRHRELLVTVCPRCLRSQRPITSTSRLGFCSRCGLWLGNAMDRTVRGPSDAVPTAYQLWLAETIGELLANAPRIQAERLRDRARRVLLTYVNEFAEGNRATVAAIAGHTVYGWCKGGNVPRIDTLLRTWYQLQLPIACLLDDAHPGLRSDVQAKNWLRIRNSREVAPNRSREQLRAALEGALHEQPSPSLNEIARRLGYRTTARLHEADRNLCRRIDSNYRKSGRGNWWRRGGAKAICERSQVKKVLEYYLGSDKPIPQLDRIASSLGYAVNKSLWEKFPELCRALSARIADQKRARVAGIESALEQALGEIPPPNLQRMSRRLGFSSVSVLEAHAPSLCEKLKTSCRAHKERCRLELRSKLEAALAENPPPSLKSVYSRLGVTEWIVNASSPELRRAIGLRHLQHQKQRSQARCSDVRREIREIVQMLHTQGICPSVPRVARLLKSGSLREWNTINNAVSDARGELIDSQPNQLGDKR